MLRINRLILALLAVAAVARADSTYRYTEQIETADAESVLKRWS